MLSKRTFLKQAAAATAVGTLAPWSPVVASGIAPVITQGGASVRRSEFDAVVFNGWYADARAFASAMSPWARHVLPTEGDAGVLWYTTLRNLAADGRARIAGMSTHADLFILETLARDAGLKVQYRGQHDCRGRSTLTHRIAACGNSTQLARAVESAGCDWPAALATALSHGTAASSAPVSEVLVCTDAKRSDDHPGALVSWVLAGPPFPTST